MTVGIGNVLAGKYQELRKRGGRQFITGEDRYFRNRGKSLEILKRYRVIQHSFDDFVITTIQIIICFELLFTSWPRIYCIL